MSSAWSSSSAPARSWRAGAWSLELRGDELADIAYRGAVVLRAVRAVIRDRNWDTATTVVEAVAEQGDALELRVRSEGLGSSFNGIVRVEADAGALTVTCDLRSAGAFDTNRTGLVVLHPPTLAGAELTVLHPDGTEEAARFPVAISPHQPVREIVGLVWKQAGLDVRLGFEGDVFEMEDQRNWTDASYKTYSRPLDLPFPYRVESGERVRQVLRVTARGNPTGSIGTAPDRIRLRPTGATFPRIGLGAATAPDPAPPAVPALSHVLVELDLATRNWRAALERAAASGAPLDVRFILDDEEADQLHRAAAALDGLLIARVSAFHVKGAAAHISTAATIDRLRAALCSAGVQAPVVGGARSHFTELNREHHRLPGDLDGVVFSITPLFHAMSTEQLVESIAMQRLVAEQAVATANGAPVHIGPITLRPRFNDVATTPPPMPEHDDLREGYGPQLIDADDGRQTARELAAWTVASVAALAVPSVASLTYFEEWGPRGLRSARGEQYPVAEAIDALRRLDGGEVLTGSSSDGLVRAIGARRGDLDVVLVANLDRRDREVVIESESDVQVRTLGSFTYATAS